MKQAHSNMYTFIVYFTNINNSKQNQQRFFSKAKQQRCCNK